MHGGPVAVNNTTSFAMCSCLRKASYSSGLFKEPRADKKESELPILRENLALRTKRKKADISKTDQPMSRRLT
jgi:hypothetical protein